MRSHTLSSDSVIFCLANMISLANLAVVSKSSVCGMLLILRSRRSSSDSESVARSVVGAGDETSSICAGSFMGVAPLWLLLSSITFVVEIGNSVFYLFEDLRRSF